MTPEERAAGFMEWIRDKPDLQSPDAKGQREGIELLIMAAVADATAPLQAIIDSLAERVAAQSALLSKRAEKERQ